MCEECSRGGCNGNRISEDGDSIECTAFHQLIMRASTDLHNSSPARATGANRSHLALLLLPPTIVWLAIAPMPAHQSRSYPALLPISKETRQSALGNPSNTIP